MTPFDRIVPAGPGRDACLYEVDARRVVGVDAAQTLLEATRARVRAGRRIQPWSAHSVNVTVAQDVDEAVRTALLAQLGHGDGIDSVAVVGLGTIDPAELTNAEQVAMRSFQEAASEAGDPWARLAEAVAQDTPLVGTVRAVDSSEAKVELGGPVGTLYLDPDAAPPQVGEQVVVRIVAFNARRQLLGLCRVRR